MNGRALGRRWAWSLWAVVVTAAVALSGVGPVTSATAVTPAAATVASDFSGDGHPDIVGPTSDGVLWLYRGDGLGGFSGVRTQIGTGWTARDQIRLVGDWDGRPGSDIIARDPNNGSLWLYSGNGAGGFRDWRAIGSGWNVFSQIFSPGDWSGDGRAALLAIRRDTGALWLYTGNGTGGFSGSRQVGTGWGSYDGFVLTGDWDGDRAIDFLARNTATGDLRLFRRDGAGGVTGVAVVGRSWNQFTAVLGVGDWSGDGHSDVLARAADGRLILYRGDGTGGWVSPYPVIGVGWQAIRLPGEGMAPPPPPPPPSAGTVYLTFDDGPNRTYTPQVLAVLRKYGVRAVFFELGQHIAAVPDVTRSVRAAGHLVGNHTWDHPDLTTLSDASITSELDRMEFALGYRPRCVRPPYGATNSRVLGIIVARGQRHILWTVDPLDWSRPGTWTIVDRVLAAVAPGARILLHDGGGDRSQTVAALDLLVPRLQARGFALGLMAC